MRGRFITIEGIEGAGKSTVIGIIEDYLRRQGRPVVSTREPGGTPLSEAMRELLLDSSHHGLTGRAELLLVFAARAQHVEELIGPALDAGSDVVCDRFTDASFAYQGGGREIGYDTVAALAEIAHPDLSPNLTLLLDLPVSLGLERAGRRSLPDRFEQETHEFFQRVRKAYLELADDAPERYVVIDASKSLKEVEQSVLQALEARL